MTAGGLRAYHFASDKHWNACLVLQADRDPVRAAGGIRPFPPFTRTSTPYKSVRAGAPAVTPGGEVLWHDVNGVLHRLSPCDDTPMESPAPFAIGHSRRMVATRSGLWVTGTPPASLQRYEDDSLTRLLTVDVPNAPVVDIAGDGDDAVWALVESEGNWKAVHVDRAGHIAGAVELERVTGATGFVFLPRSRRFVVLAGERLHWFSAEGGPATFRVALGALHPCFTATALGNDSHDRVLVAGADGDAFCGGAYVLILDSDGNLMDEVPLDALDAPATGVAATRDSLIVTGQRGALQFAATDVVPDSAGELTCTLITPMLHSPDREDGRRWLRAEATARLPEGATLEITYAATDDKVLCDRIIAIAADESRPAGQRVQEIRSEPDFWRERTVFHGSDPASEHASAPFSAKLFDVKERFLWVSMTLRASAGARLPALSQLEVLYPGRTLMENLPAIYQRAETEPHAFIRDLVGVLEATTQDLDAAISTMGSRIHPMTASGAWLDFVAGWLGVPWDNALDEAQKRALVLRSSELATARGTRAGLEALLDCLMPGTPRRYRVSDATADFGFATVGDTACAGSALPAILGGFTRWSAALDSQAVLGRMRLPCAGQFDDGAWQLAGSVRVDVAASAKERKAWEPWLLALIKEMVPLTARVNLRWVSRQALRSDRLDGSLTLEAAPAPHLGTDAVTGLARLPERGSRLSATGPDIHTLLR